jgi:hypothetical protein
MGAARRSGRWFGVFALSAAAMVAVFFLRMNAAYGPFHLSFDASDWMVLWELWRHGQIAAGVVAESAALGIAAAAVPWAVAALRHRALWRPRRRRSTPAGR